MISVPLHPSRITNAKKKRAQTETAPLQKQQQRAPLEAKKRARRVHAEESLSAALAQRAEEQSDFCFLSRNDKNEEAFF